MIGNALCVLTCLLYTSIYLEYFTTSNREDLGVIADKVRSTDECALLVLVGNKTNDFPLLISVSKELSKSLNANKVMRALTSTFGGRGGGRPDFANGVLLNLSLIHIFSLQLKIHSSRALHTTRLSLGDVYLYLLSCLF